MICTYTYIDIYIYGLYGAGFPRSIALRIHLSRLFSKGTLSWDLASSLGVSHAPMRWVTFSGSVADVDKPK